MCVLVCKKGRALATQNDLHDTKAKAKNGRTPHAAPT